jgi:hypothetical protein
MRALGDAYVKEEWKKHTKADSKFVASFIDEWSKYLETLKVCSWHIT